MSRMKKTKVSVTLSGDILAEIDAFASRSGIGNRSNVIELWLRRAARDEAAAKLDEDTVAYYSRLTEEEKAEDSEWADFASGELGRIGID